MAHFAGFAVDQGIVEGCHVARGHPHLRVHQNGGILSHVIGVLLDEFFPPGFFDIIFKFHAQRAVIPGIGKTTVNFAAGIDKAASFAERNDLIHGFLLIGKHDNPSELPIPIVNSTIIYTIRGMST
ncbi:hypothetical protein SDC9_84077 [bioreactor metagenome]|uniref:Uncharacterized protein n=1 Tax=bioreactor metagenome TaxID=1076179 RepID=A0A644Z995_9ZZZZ